MKKAAAILLSAIMALGCMSVSAVSAEETGSGAAAKPSAFASQQALYAHAVSGSNDTEAWQAWQSVHDERMSESNSSEKYFFLPASADTGRGKGHT